MCDDPVPRDKDVGKRRFLIVAGTQGYVTPQGGKKIYHGKGLYSVTLNTFRTDYEAYIIEPPAYVAGRRRVMSYICGPLFEKLTNGYPGKISKKFYRKAPTLVLCLTTDDSEILKLWPDKIYFEPVLTESNDSILWKFISRYFKALKWVKRLTEYHQKNTKYKEAQKLILGYAEGVPFRLSTLASKFPPKPSNKLVQRKYRESKNTMSPTLTSTYPVPSTES